MGFVCSNRGKEHEGVAAVASIKPDYWLTLTDKQKAKGKIDRDLCASYDGHFLVRCVLELPLLGATDPSFDFGQGSSLSEENFGRSVESCDNPKQSRLGDMFGRRANEIRGFLGLLTLSCRVRPGDDRPRPLIVRDLSDNPLFLAPRDGITFDRALHLAHEFL